MKVQTKTLDEERTLIIAMIVDKVALAKISSRWSRDMFRSPYANTIGQWCVDYFLQYGKVPGPHIQSIYESWAADSRDKALIELIGNFLDGLSKQYQRLRKTSNSQYVIDLAARYFNRVKLSKLSEAIEGDISLGKINKAISRTTEFRRVEMGVGEGVNVLEDKDSIKEAFDRRHDPLITYNDKGNVGGLGKFFGNRLERDGLIGIMGPDKRGKSFWLLDLAFRAVIQKRKVAFFEAGDLSKNQIMLRFMSRIARQPQFPCSYRYPIAYPEVTEPPTTKLVTCTTPLTWQTAYKHCRKLTNGGGLKSALRLSCHFNETLRVDAINNYLDEWERDGWVPDVIVIDYADILNMDYPGIEGRDRTDRTWKQLRRMSQERHCLVITATQSDSAAYDAKTISRKHFSEDKRKMAHVTGMVGLNQTPKEKDWGVMRLNWIVLRESFFSERHCCYVATCLERANMAVRSRM